jgi:heme oxygenase
VDAALRDGAWCDTREAYAAHLVRTLRFHRLVEDATRAHAGTIPGLDHRPRSPDVLADLAVVAAPAPVFVDASVATWVTAALQDSGPAGALGCLYVVEGATLGGRVLVHWVRQRLGYDAGCGARSLVPYGAWTVARWRAFGAVVEAWVRRAPEDLELMVDAAAATFEAYRATVIGAPSGRGIGAA